MRTIGDVAQGGGAGGGSAAGPSTRLLRLPGPRGPLSEELIDALAGPPGRPLGPSAPAADPLGDDDLQLALYLCYELHYADLAGVDPRWEWDPALLAFRSALETQFEEALRAWTPAPARPGEASVGQSLRDLVRADDGPSLSRHVEARATLGQVREFAIHRSAYQLKEADPHSWAIPRLAGGPKAALVEIQADEYGGGDPERAHAVLFARAMTALGLDCSYGAYLELIPGPTLATVNLMSLCGLHRRLRGALVGHLAAFEMTSPIPNARYAKGLRRLGLGRDATEFFDEHVEADAVHEQVAAWDLADGLARSEPALAGDVLFGARALLLLEGRWASHLLDRWERGASSLRRPTEA